MWISSTLGSEALYLSPISTPHKMIYFLLNWPCRHSICMHACMYVCMDTYTHVYKLHTYLPSWHDNERICQLYVRPGQLWSVATSIGLPAGIRSMSFWRWRMPTWPTQHLRHSFHLIEPIVWLRSESWPFQTITPLKNLKKKTLFIPPIHNIIHIQHIVMRD